MRIKKQSAATRATPLSRWTAGRLLPLACPPREVLAYLRDVAMLRAPRYIGHNPAGGAMIVALLVALAGTCATGYMMTMDAYWGSKLVEHIHEFLANLTVGLVVAHVLGVLIASFEHRENLVASMISGRKRAAD